MGVFNDTRVLQGLVKALLYGWVGEKGREEAGGRDGKHGAQRLLTHHKFTTNGPTQREEEGLRHAEEDESTN